MRELNRRDPIWSGRLQFRDGRQLSDLCLCSGFKSHRANNPHYCMKPNDKELNKGTPPVLILSEYPTFHARQDLFTFVRPAVNWEFNLTDATECCLSTAKFHLEKDMFVGHGDENMESRKSMRKACGRSCITSEGTKEEQSWNKNNLFGVGQLNLAE